MSWAKFDDRFDDNRKIKRAWRRDRGSVGVYIFAATYCARHETDGLIDLDLVEEWLPNAKEREKTIGVLADARLLDRLPAGETAVVTDTDENEITLGPVDVEAFIVHDYLQYNPSSLQGERTREWDRKRKELHRDVELVTAIRERDQDRCRYCAQQVNWKDRRGPTGATYDHVVPRGPNSLENVVVACRRCSLSKGARTPEQAGIELLPPGSLGSSIPPTRLGSRSDPDAEPNQAQIRPVNPSRPVPSPPDPTYSEPPNPPMGGRARDRERWRMTMDEWVLAHPAIDSDEWSAVLAELQAHVEPSAFNLHIAPLHIHADGDELLVGAPAQTTRWIDDRFGKLIADAAGKPARFIDCGCETAARSAA